MLGVIAPLVSSTPAAIGKPMQSFSSQRKPLLPKKLAPPVPAATQSAIERLTIPDNPTALFCFFSDGALLQALNQFSAPSDTIFAAKRGKSSLGRRPGRTARGH